MNQTRQIPKTALRAHCKEEAQLGRGLKLDKPTHSPFAHYRRGKRGLKQTLKPSIFKMQLMQPAFASAAFLHLCGDLAQFRKHSAQRDRTGITSA